MTDSHLTSLFKSMSWRIIGTIDTIVISYFITGNTTKSLSIGGIELATKTLLFYLHERFWIKVMNNNEN